MENQSYPASKHSLMYGVYISVVMIIFSLVFYVLNLHMENWTSYINYAVLLVGIIITTVQYRDKRMGGFATYGQCFTPGFLAGLFASIIVAIFTFIYINMLGESFIAEIMQRAEENMLKQNPNMSDDQIDMALKWTENMMKPGWMAVMALVINTFLSLVFALIVSIFVKKQQPETTGV